MASKSDIKHGNEVYNLNRQRCGRKSDFLKKNDFIKYVIKHFLKIIGRLMYAPIAVWL